jgi:LCCL domain
MQIYKKMIKPSTLLLSTMIAISMVNISKSYAQGIKQIDWSTTAYEIRDRLDQDFTYICPSGGSIRNVYGTDLYTSASSICTAATHSGLINARDGGQVTVRVRPGADFYNPSFRNNISSQRYGGYGSSFVFLNANGQPLSSNKQIELIEWNTTAYNIRTRLDQEFTFDCPKNGVIHSVYGTDIYTSDSSICTSAVHSGIISNKKGGIVTVFIRPGGNNYRGTIRNGVKSQNYGEYGSSFSFIKKRSSALIESPNQTIADTPSEPSTDNVANTSSNCQEADRTFVTAETNNFFLFICGKNKPTYYIGTAKDNSGSIRLPISSTGTKKYTIKNGNAAYILTPQNLTITQNGRVIQKDPILSSQWQ